MNCFRVTIGSHLGSEYPRAPRSVLIRIVLTLKTFRPHSWDLVHCAVCIIPVYVVQGFLSCNSSMSLVGLIVFGGAAT